MLLHILHFTGFAVFHNWKLSVLCLCWCRRKPSSLYMKHPVQPPPPSPPNNTRPPRLSLCVRLHRKPQLEPPQQNFWPETGQLNRSCPLGVCSWERDKTKNKEKVKKQHKRGLKNKEDSKSSFFSIQVYMVTGSGVVTLCFQINASAPGK